MIWRKSVGSRKRNEPGWALGHMVYGVEKKIFWGVNVTWRAMREGSAPCDVLETLCSVWSAIRSNTKVVTGYSNGNNNSGRDEERREGGSDGVLSM